MIASPGTFALSINCDRPGTACRGLPGRAHSGMLVRLSRGRGRAPATTARNAGSGPEPIRTRPH